MIALGWTSQIIIFICFYLVNLRSQVAAVPDLNTLLSHEKKLSSFYSLVQKYPQVLLQLPSYAGVTILAPSNDAFEKIPFSEYNEAFKNGDQDVITNLLEYHILQGTRDAAHLKPGAPVFLPTLLASSKWTNVTGGQKIQNIKQAGNAVVFVSGQGRRSTLTKADLEFTGGKVQVIDSILIPPSNLTKTATSFSLDSFLGALYSSGRIPDLVNTRNLTILAPNNQAFEVLGPAITNLTVEKLGSVIDYHVLPDVIYSTGLTNQTKLLTKHGQEITVLHSGNNIYVNSAQLVSTDILLANGVLHVIDNVLNPQEIDAQPNPEIASQVPAFASATEADNTPFTDAIPCTSSCPQTTDTSGSSASAGQDSRTSFHTASSKALGASVARETGIRKAAGIMLALGGAVFLV
ncbi:hypothetical protein Golomagni_02884 [Golovinomyces magnicellulatus]|nr:hypothetical protein Golomagni_02884 [Golovinomyces magnicellulatus]